MTMNVLSELFLVSEAARMVWEAVAGVKSKKFYQSFADPMRAFFQWAQQKQHVLSHSCIFQSARYKKCMG